MAQIKEFFAEIDAKWKPIGSEPIPLEVIGSAALMLQTDYARATKDSDILETAAVTPAVKTQLELIAGRETEIYKRRRIYIDVVAEAIPFMPQEGILHPIPHLQLKNFSLSALDITDVVVSKLWRFTRNDLDDIRAMIERSLVAHDGLIARFKAAVDRFSIDARAEDLPRCVQNLHTVERDLFDAAETEIDLPDWMKE